MKKNESKNIYEEELSTNDVNFVNDKQPESYDTVLDEVIGTEDEEENVEAEYEGYSEEELDDEPQL